MAAIQNLKAAGIAVSGAALLLATSHARAEPLPARKPDIVIQRSGLHFQFALGWGGGPTSHGVLHNMELGGSLGGGYSLCYQHVFIWSKDLFKPRGGSDLWGGHHLMLKIPVTARLVYKVAVGLGENVTMKDGFKPTFGIGWTMGIDRDFPIWPTSGVTLSALVINAYTPDARFQIGGGATVGYTWF